LGGTPIAPRTGTEEVFDSPRAALARDLENHYSFVIGRAVLGIESRGIMMRQLLPRLATAALAVLLWLAATLASMPAQTKTINVLSTENHDCVDLTFRAARLGPHLYSIRLNVPDRCTGCRIQHVSARILFDINYCQYRFKSVGGRNAQSIRILESLRTVELKGPDPSVLRRHLATM